MNTIVQLSSIKKVLKWALISMFLFTVTGFFMLPPILKFLLVSKLSDQLHRQVIIGKIKINPFILSFWIYGFEVKDPAGTETFVSFSELYVN